MPKKLTVNDIAYLLEDNGMIQVTFEQGDSFFYDTPRYEIAEIVAKYGDRVVTWITDVPEDGDERLAIELEGAE